MSNKNQNVSAQNIQKFFLACEEDKVEFIDFRFTDIKGTWHHISFNIDAISEDSFTKGIPFDGSSISAWQPINQSDMILLPDLQRYFIDPFTADTTMIVFCDVWDIYKNQPYEKCPRSIIKRAVQYVKDTNIGEVVYFGPENEFFIFDSIKIRDSMNCQYYEIDTEDGDWNRDREYEGINLGHRPGAKGGYFPVAPVDNSVDLRAEMVKVLNQVGIKTYVNHHEVAQGQNEIGILYADMLEAADNVQIFKYIVKMVAHINGKTATFMPKPLHNDNGSGMHTHISIWKNGKNLFAGDAYQGMSEYAMHFLGGVLKHARGLAAITNASTNSYKRLIPGFEAPSILTYSAQNRSASIRIPYNDSKKTKRMEFRFPDSSANPYLAFSALVMAGIDGIKNKIDPGKPMEMNLFKLSLDEIRAKGIKQLPHTLRNAIEEMLLDHEYLKQGNVFSEEFIQTYKAYKFKTEVWPWEARPHPFEFTTTFNC